MWGMLRVDGGRGGLFRVGYFVGFDRARFLRLEVDGKVRERERGSDRIARGDGGIVFRPGD